MKRILIIMLIALVAIVGTASAYDANLYTADGSAPSAGTLYLKPGSSLTLTYYMDNFPSDMDFGNDTLTYTYTVTPKTAGASASDIMVSLPTDVTPLNEPYKDIGAVVITMDSNTTVGNKYLVEIGAGNGSVEIDVGSAARTIESIPEFPTVALPIAAIIGIAFFMQRRKEE